MRTDTFSETGGKEAKMGGDISKIVVWEEDGKLTQIQNIKIIQHEVEGQKCSWIQEVVLKR